MESQRESGQEHFSKSINRRDQTRERQSVNEGTQQLKAFSGSPGHCLRQQGQCSRTTYATVEERRSRGVHVRLRLHAVIRTCWKTMQSKIRTRLQPAGSFALNPIFLKLHSFWPVGKGFRNEKLIPQKYFLLQTSYSRSAKPGNIFFCQFNTVFTGF